jgi:hypothetical protein
VTPEQGGPPGPAAPTENVWVPGSAGRADNLWGQEQAMPAAATETPWGQEPAAPVDRAATENLWMQEQVAPAGPTENLWIPVRPERSGAALILPLLVGGAVAVALGVYGKQHQATGSAVKVPGFSSALTFKTWFATGSAALAVVQLVSAFAMYGKLPRLFGGRLLAGRSWLAGVHRYSGRIAFLLAVPVAVHCLYAFGFQDYTRRVLIHSLAGCFFFGAFAAKMLGLTRSRLPGWALPVLGGLVFTGLVVLWLTSSLWFFTTVGVRR